MPSSSDGSNMDKSQQSKPVPHGGHYFLDPSSLQRPPSGMSIRSFVRSQRDQGKPEFSENTTDQSLIPEEVADEVDKPASPSSVSQDKFSPWCIECVKPYPVLEKSDISPGDHIIYSGAIYDHHAIVGEVDFAEDQPINKVKLTLIHATNTTFGAVAGVAKFFGGKANVRETKEILDYKTAKIKVVKYSVMLYTPEEIIERARDAVKNNTFKYHLFQNNCEHFATWCVTDKRLSVQVGKFYMTMRMYFSMGFQGLSDEKERNKVAFENNLLCKSCYQRNDKLFAAERVAIIKREDVLVGDIITYTYWYLYHDAVVLKKKEETTGNEIGLTIAHYAFCGVTKHRTIVEEDISIPLDGSVTVTRYTAPHFATYTSEETVERAKKRIGEQIFTFFANDSSHFARWCKLKLTHDQTSLASNIQDNTNQ